MDVIDQTLAANQKYADRFSLASLNIPPAKKLAVLACMDARVNVEDILGLQTGDAHIIRNAGGIVTEDALRSLIISHHLLGTQEIMLIHHTDCGMLTFRDDELKEKLQKETNSVTVSPEYFHAFSNLHEDVSRQVHKVKSHPWLPKGLPVRGFVFNVKTGKLAEVSE